MTLHILAAEDEARRISERTKADAGLKLRLKGCRDTCHPCGCGLPLLRGYERLQQKGTTRIAARLR